MAKAHRAAAGVRQTKPLSDDALTRGRWLRAKAQIHSHPVLRVAVFVSEMMGRLAEDQPRAICSRRAVALARVAPSRAISEHRPV